MNQQLTQHLLDDLKALRNQQLRLVDRLDVQIAHLEAQLGYMAGTVSDDDHLARLSPTELAERTGGDLIELLGRSVHPTSPRPHLSVIKGGS